MSSQERVNQKRKKSVKTMASFASFRHHVWRMQAAWTNFVFFLFVFLPYKGILYPVMSPGGLSKEQVAAPFACGHPLMPPSPLLWWVILMLIPMMIDINKGTITLGGVSMSNMITRCTLDLFIILLFSLTFKALQGCKCAGEQC